MPPEIYNAKNAKKATRLRRLTFFGVHTPRVQPRRAILPPQAWLKRVGGGGPPRGVTIKLPDVESEVEFEVEFEASKTSEIFQLSSTRGLLAIVRGPRRLARRRGGVRWGGSPPR